MIRKPVVAIAGATGAQGGGLARAILEDRDSPFAVRALTRNPDSAAARELARQGAEVVAADADDPESLERAFAGAYAAYCVTFYWQHFSPERETAQATAMARAAAHAGLGHVIWSTLEDTRRFVPLDDGRMPTLMGRYKVPHFDSKGEADAVFEELGLPVTYLLTSFYWDNFIHFGSGPARNADGRLVLSLPIGSARLPGIAARDIGGCAYGILKRGPEFAGRRVGVASGHLTGEEMAAGLSEAMGERVDYEPLPHAVFRSLDIPHAEDLGNMFQFNTEFSREFCEARDPRLARELNPGMLTFRQWAEANRGRIPVQ
ncbi:MAG: NmrA/HSCARG family protein [Bryobacteraceae bacterium]|nr:NmrA/HSCARG family protein [Bryobacteraceae bacterium]